MWPPSPPGETRATKTAHEGRLLRDELVSLLRQRGLQVWGSSSDRGRTRTGGTGPRCERRLLTGIARTEVLLCRPVPPSTPACPVAQGASRARRDTATGPAGEAQDLETAVELHPASRARGRWSLQRTWLGRLATARGAGLRRLGGVCRACSGHAARHRRRVLFVPQLVRGF